MNKIKITLLLLSFLFISAGFSQNIKPVFKRFVVVYYRTSGIGNKKFVRIESYNEINSAGIVRDVYNVFDNDYGDLSLKGYMGDTSYNTPDSLITIINKVFGDGKELNHQTILKSLAPDHHFAGPFTLYFLY